MTMKERLGASLVLSSTKRTLLFSVLVYVTYIEIALYINCGVCLSKFVKVKILFTHTM
jgi:hypothetical protein